MVPSLPSPRKRTVFVIVWSLLALALLIATREILLPFILALVIAYVLTPAVSLVERTRVPRWVAVLIVYAVTLGGIYTFFSLTTPRLAREVVGLRRELPTLSAALRDQWVPAIYERMQRYGLIDAEPAAPPRTDAPTADPAHVDPPPTMRVRANPDGSYDVVLASEVEVRAAGEGVWRISTVAPEDAQRRDFDPVQLLKKSVDKVISYGRRNILEVVRFGSQIVAFVSRGIFLFFLTLMLAAYIMITRERLFEFFRVLVRPAHRASFEVLLRRLDRGLSGVVRGQLLICAVNGVLSALGFWLISLKYWPVLAVVAGVMSIIPIFGSILSAIPAVAIGLTQGIGTGLFVLGWIVGIHQLEANLLNPKIYGIAAKIHPVLVIFSLLVGEHFFGLFGALFAVPTMSVVQNVFLHLRTVALGADAPQDTFFPPPNTGPSEPGA